LRQSLDNIGAVVGPLAATLLMLSSGQNFRFVFWIAVLPAVFSVMTLFLTVQEPNLPRLTLPTLRWRWKELQQFSQEFWVAAAIGGVFTLARFSEAFLVLRASDLGLGYAYAPLVMVVMNVFYSVSAYPAGSLSDRIDRRLMLAIGAATLVVADVILATTDSGAWLVAGIAIWGLHMGLTQGLLTALVADTAPPDRRGTAFGIFNVVSGAALLAASVAAGAFWDRIGAAATFYAGAVFATIALIALVLYVRLRPAAR
jgi:MFS family permease